MIPLELNHLVQTIDQKIANGQFKDAATLVSIGLIWYPRDPSLISFHAAIPSQYDHSFFAEAYQGSLASARLFLRHLHTHYAFATAVDVGAGAGAWSQAAIELGKAVLSIDGNWVRDIEKPCDKINYLYQDLNSTISSDRAFDLAICVEVAEHLVPERSCGFVADLCNLAPVILFGASLPRQGGVGHINCRPHSYWIDQFQRRRFTALDLFRPAFWYDGRVEPWYAQNTFLFVADSKLAQLAMLPRPSLVDVYHPRVAIDSPICLQDHLQGRVDPGAN